MKSIFTFLLIVLTSTILFAQTPVEVTTGASYANEVYYSFENDVLKTTARNNWDVAFKTSQMSVSVLANSGIGTMVYTWTKGTIADWETVDTTGMAWKPLYNSIVDWEYGAFNANTIPGNAFDYGWGTYNVTSHSIAGDSIFIVKLANGNYKKFAVKQKNAVQNVWTYKCAGLDGSMDTTVTFDSDNYKPQTYAYFSLSTHTSVDKEPAERWQLLFTKYYDYTIPYYVTGVLANSGVKIQQVKGVSQNDFVDYQTSLFNDTLSQIGYDWKKLNASYTYDVTPDLVFFVQDTTTVDKSIWKLYFTGFSGGGTGTYSFVKTKLGTTNASGISERSLAVYPNPANQEINVIHDFNGITEITVYNVSGQPVLRNRTSESNGLNKNTLDISTLSSGIYNLRISSGNEVKTVKFLKQ